MGRHTAFAAPPGARRGSSATTVQALGERLGPGLMNSGIFRATAVPFRPCRLS